MNDQQKTSSVREREEGYESKKRKREAWYIVLSLISIVLLTWAEVHLARLRAAVRIESKILIFGLINILILLIIVLVYLVFRNVAKLLMERRQNVIGAKLRTKLVLAFVGLSLVPTMLLFFVSAGFITTSIKSWFSEQVENSLDESVEVAQTYYRSASEYSLHYGRQIARLIRDEQLMKPGSLPELRQAMEGKQKEYKLGIVEVFSGRTEIVRTADSSVPMQEFTTPAAEDILAGLQGQELSRVNPMGKADLIRAIVPVHSDTEPGQVAGVVVVSYHVPYSLASQIKEISASYYEYRQFKILKNPIKTWYILTLFMITVVIAILAIWFGVYLAKSLTTPIQELAEATRQIADGHLDIKLGESATDEIGLLITSFNKMTEDLRMNREALEETHDELLRTNDELEQRRRYMETVLKNVTAGVISIDSRGHLSTINTSAERLLDLNAAQLLGRNFRDVLSASHLTVVKEMLRDMVISRQDSVSKQITIQVNENKLTLLLNLTVLKDENGEFLGTVVVFDDLTELIKAQRMAAWREVARRIAHEIKNPLTPIRLSAQRLRKRYLSQFTQDDRVFDESTEIIIRSVDELKTLVDEFSQFARMPAAHPAPNNLNEIIREALTLFQEAHRSVEFRFDPDEHLPPLLLDRDQIKRVLINLLDNAVAATEERGTVTVESRYDPDLKMATMVVTDNGEGIPAEDRSRVFEPYFSTKKNGTGLGLAIVASIIADHHGFIRVKENSPRGAKFIIELAAEA